MFDSCMRSPEVQAVVPRGKVIRSQLMAPKAPFKSAQSTTKVLFLILDCMVAVCIIHNVYLQEQKTPPILQGGKERRGSRTGNMMNLH